MVALQKFQHIVGQQRERLTQLPCVFRQKIIEQGRDVFFALPQWRQSQAYAIDPEEELSPESTSRNLFLQIARCCANQSRRVFRIFVRVFGVHQRGEQCPLAVLIQLVDFVQKYRRGSVSVSVPMHCVRNFILEPISIRRRAGNFLETSFWTCRHLM